MDDHSVVLHHETHPAGGLFEIVADGDAVKAVYQMPFDLSTGEWDFLRDTYDRLEFTSALRTFTDTRVAAAVNGREGNMRFFSTPKGDTVQLTNATGPHSKSHVFVPESGLDSWVRKLDAA